MCELCVSFGANALRGQPQGAWVNALKAGWEGREQAGFPTGGSLVQPAPTDGPTCTDVSFALHSTVRSFPCQFQAPLSTNSDAKTL